MKERICFILSFCTIIKFTNAQTNQLGSWNILNIKAPLSAKTTVVFETQARSQSFNNDFFYHEFKGGVNLKLKSGFELFLGIGEYTTYQFVGNFKTPLQNKEIRPWQQLIYKHKWGKITIDHRLRIEQRFTTKQYRNRFRYRLNVVSPINAVTLKPKSFYFNAFNELFFNNESPNFERNRFFAGVGYEFNNKTTVQLGWVYQYDLSKNRNFDKHFVQSSVLLTIPNKRDKKMIHAETMD